MVGVSRIMMRRSSPMCFSLMTDHVWWCLILILGLRLMMIRVRAFIISLHIKGHNKYKRLKKLTLIMVNFHHILQTITKIKITTDFRSMKKTNSQVLNEKMDKTLVKEKAPIILRSIHIRTTLNRWQHSQNTTHRWKTCSQYLKNHQKLRGPIITSMGLKRRRWGIHRLELRKVSTLNNPKRHLNPNSFKSFKKKKKLNNNCNKNMQFTYKISDKKTFLKSQKLIQNKGCHKEFLKVTQMS